MVLSLSFSFPAPRSFPLHKESSQWKFGVRGKQKREGERRKETKREGNTLFVQGFGSLHQLVLRAQNSLVQIDKGLLESLQKRNKNFMLALVYQLQLGVTTRFSNSLFFFFIPLKTYLQQSLSLTHSQATIIKSLHNSVSFSNFTVSCGTCMYASPPFLLYFSVCTNSSGNFSIKCCKFSDGIELSCAKLAHCMNKRICPLEVYSIQ